MAEPIQKKPAGSEGILNATVSVETEKDEKGVPYVRPSASSEQTGVVCDICGDTTDDDDRITSENWEFCEGLQKQFCGACRKEREEPPCDDAGCHADVCYEKRLEKFEERRGATTADNMAAALYPTSLNMRPCVCFYCSADYENDERTLGEAFGIRYCAEHKATAKRDSNAYLHEVGHVKTGDALAHAVLGPLLEHLKTPTTIRRSNGTWDGGWELECGFSTTLKREGGVWHIPMKNEEKGITKGVALPTFCDEAFVVHNPHLSPLDFAAAKAVLDEGVYAAWCSPPSHVPETSNIHTLCINGSVARVFLPERTGQALEAQLENVCPQ